MAWPPAQPAAPTPINSQDSRSRPAVRRARHRALALSTPPAVSWDRSSTARVTCGPPGCSRRSATKATSASTERAPQRNRSPAALPSGTRDTGSTFGKAASERSQVTPLYRPVPAELDRCALTGAADRAGVPFPGHRSTGRRGAAADDELRREHHAAGTFHHTALRGVDGLGQCGRRRATLRDDVLADRRQVRPQLAGEGAVVEADERHVTRYLQPDGPGGPQDAAGPRVGEAQDGGRARRPVEQDLTGLVAGVGRLAVFHPDHDRFEP